MRKSFLRGASITAALVFALSAAAYAEIPADGQTNAEKFAAANGLSSDWESWKKTWETEKNDWTDVSITPGSNETELNFAWYSKTQKAKFVVRADMEANGPDADGSYYMYEYSEEVTGVADKEIVQGGVQYYACKATIKNLKPGKYTYQIDDGKAVSFTVQDTSKGFSFIFVGDPQIGSSNSMKGSKASDEASAAKFYAAQSDAVRSDAFNW
ncbi:MAG: calcineurin-like phosphoesterase, partial [Oscillospiraceae bacterium]